MERISLRRSVEAARALALGNPDVKLDRAYADAVARLDEEVDELHYASEAARRDAKIRQKIGW